MRKFIILLIITINYQLLTVPQIFAQKQIMVTIKGKLTNNSYQNIYLDKYEKETTVLDTAKITNNVFTLNVIVPSTGFYNLRLASDKTMLLILSPGENVELAADVNNFGVPISISGSAQTELALEIGRKLNVFERKQDSLNQVYEKYKNSDKKDSIVAILRDAFDKFAAKQKSLIKDFINNNPGSLSGLMFIDKIDAADNVELFTKYDNELIKKYPDNGFVNEFHQQVIKNIKLANGSPAPDIIEKDTAGKTVSLSSFRGKYVLIDFWASWCGPCRRESPNMVKLYNKFHDKGFEIFSVSLDKDRNSWLAAIKKDGLKWTHVSDLGYWNSKHAHLYNVSSIPYTVLLDKDGKIIAKGLYGQQVEERLEGLLKN